LLGQIDLLCILLINVKLPLSQKISKFHYWSDSFFGGQIELNLKKNIITVETREGFGGVSVVSHTPTEEEWEEFVSSLDILKVWEWDKNYNEHLICDGISWSVTIHTNVSQLESGGYGELPPNFDIFCQSINRLMSDEIL
jgi:hypothetical protein